MGDAGLPGVAEHRPNQEAEAPSIDFAGAGRTVPWVGVVRAEQRPPGGKKQIFASRFDAAAQHLAAPRARTARRPNSVPSLNIHTNRDAENPAVVGGAAVAGADPVPWVAWQEHDGAAGAGHRPDLRLARRQADATAAGCSRRAATTASTASAGSRSASSASTPTTRRSGADGDPTLNIDPTRDGIEPDIAFTGPSDTVPWVVWYEKGAGAQRPRAQRAGVRGQGRRRRRRATAASTGRPSATAPPGRPTCSTPAGAHHFGACRERRRRGRAAR